MKIIRILIIVVVVVLCIGIGRVVTRASVGILEAPQGAFLALPEGHSIDLGIVMEGEKYTASFPVENRGNELLRIVKIKSSCGCAGAEAKDTELGPGESSVIDVHYTGRDVREAENMNIVIFTNEEHREYLVLNVTAQVQLETFWYPKAVSFYDNGQDNQLSQDIRFLSAYDDLRIVSVKTSDPTITVAPWKKRDQIGCTVSLGSDNPVGNCTVEVLLDLQYGSKRKSVRVPVYVMHPAS